MKLPGFERSERPASAEQVAAAERLLGVEFPAEYRALLSEYAGANGDAEFPFPESNAVGSVGLWLSPVPWERESIWTTTATWEEHELPECIVPIAEDGGANLLCLDYRSAKEPEVAFWFHELAGADGLRFAASSFKEFLHRLRPGEA